MLIAIVPPTITAAQTGKLVLGQVTGTSWWWYATEGAVGVPGVMLVKSGGSPPMRTLYPFVSIGETIRRKQGVRRHCTGNGSRLPDLEWGWATVISIWFQSWNEQGSHCEQIYEHAFVCTFRQQCKRATPAYPVIIRQALCIGGLRERRADKSGRSKPEQHGEKASRRIGIIDSSLFCMQNPAESAVRYILQMAVRSQG
ncbi:hypothetical protein K474DRAFT_1700328 [Panus rudis PR-1116 ss-1]|nr:hypothetical protein K474DRAFT_1700328 [Panus rudis PR-1116 ss-1]